MPLAQVKVYTEEDYYNLPENVRAELIDGKLIYNQAAPSRIHQSILMELSGTISSHDYILKLNLYANAGVREYWIVDPYKERIFVYGLEEAHFEVETYTFHDSIPVGIYEDLQIDFDRLDF